MQCKHGLRSDLRSPGRSFLTLFLFFLVMALLGSSLGTVWSVRSTLKTLSQSYVTIATAVLDSGTENPDPAVLNQAAAEMDALPLPEGALRWSPNRFAQAWLSQAENVIDNHIVSGYGVVLVHTNPPGAFSTRNTLPASTLKVLFSTKEVEKKNLEIYAETLEPDKTYLIYGRWYEGQIGAAYCMEALEPPLEIPDPDAWQQTPGAQAYLDLAERMDVRRNSVQAVFPQDPAVSFPFQQKAVQLQKGRSFTPEELSSGARVCMISEWLAKLEGLQLGDRLPLSLAVGNETDRSDSYEPSRGFDLESEFEIVGILYTKNDWRSTVFLPPQKELDLSRARSESLLGQFLLDNDRAEEFVAASERLLPDGVHATVYDQGYREAAEPLQIMLRTSSIISLVCVAAGLCFLILNLWLFVSRQRQAGLLMHRLGAPRAAIPVYFLSAMLLLALPALAGGVWFSHWAAGVVTRRLGEALARDPNAGTRFSDAKLSLRQTVELIERPASLTLYFVIAGVLLVLSCLLCWLLAERTVPRRKPRGRLHSLRTRTRTQALRGGAAKYALLAAKRGGFRSAVTLLAPLAAALLLCGLNQTRQNTAQRLLDLEENTEIRGYFTDLKGSGATVAMLKYQDVISVSSLPQTLHATATINPDNHVQIVSALEMEPLTVEWYPNENMEGEPKLMNFAHYTAVGPFRIPEIPYGRFQASRLDRQSKTNDPPVISTNSMSDVPQLMFRTEQIQWLGFYSDESMQFVPIYLQEQPDGSFISVNDPALATTVTIPASSQPGYLEQTSPEKNWDAEQKKVRGLIDKALEYNLLSERINCVVSDALLKEWNLRLGSYFLCATTGCWESTGKGYLSLSPFYIIGVYHGSSPKDPIYVPAQLPMFIGEDGQALYKSYRSTRKLYDDVTNVQSAVFRFKASNLEGLKETLESLGLTMVGDSSGIRKPFLLEDQVFLATKRSVEQRLWYMDRIFPVVSALVLLLAVILSVLQLLARRREIWLMHCTGTGRGRAFGSLFSEQAGLCLLGLGAGLGLCSYWKLLTQAGITLSIVFCTLWLLGTGVMALRLTNRPRRTGREE